MRSRLFLLSLLISLTSLGQVDSVSVIMSDSLGITGQGNPSFTVDELDSQAGDQAVSGLLQSNRDVFLNNAGFNFSAARFRIRGLDGNNFTVMLNGVKFNDPELGFALWNNWGGLNDIFRYPETGVGVSANPFHFGGIQGYSNVNMRASSQRAGTRISYSYSDRSYRHRPMVTYNTGMQDNGWALSFSTSARVGNEGYVEGTSYSNVAYYISLEKKVNENHSLGVMGLGSPSLVGRSGLSTQEAYDLRNDNFYNPYWGYQNGEKRNSRMRFTNQPIAMVWHDFKISEKTKLNSNIYTQFGSQYDTRFNWDDANDPRPDYYRNLPSYAVYDGEPQNSPGLVDAWENDPSFYQLDWDSFYQANYVNLHTVENADGKEGNSFTGFRSKYIIEEAHSDPFMLGFNTVLTHKFSETMRVNVGLNTSVYNSDNYKVVNDFLGGEYWLDIDRFALTDFFETNGFQSNLDNPNNVVQEDERYGYDYEIAQKETQLFTQLSGETEKLDYYVGATVDFTSFWREGKFRNGLFPENSKGESEHQNFTSGGVKGGVNYKISGRHFLSMNAAVLSRAPITRNAFLSPRTRNTITPDLVNEKVNSLDVNYLIRYPRFKGRLTWYTTNVNDQVNVFTFFDQESNSLVNLATTNIDQRTTGIELGWEANVTSTVTVSGALAQGRNIYKDRPTVTTVLDNSDAVYSSQQAYLKNYHVGRSPETALNIGVTYRDPHYWFTGLNYSYFANMYLQPLGSRRTETQVAPLIESDPQYDQLVDQVKLDNGGVLNFFAGKSWRFQRKYYLLLTMNMSNVLDKTDFVTGGYEQGRPTYSNVDLFDNKYGYMYGRTYFAMVRFSF
jgi:hypothetical protein